MIQYFYTSSDSRVPIQKLAVLFCFKNIPHTVETCHFHENKLHGLI